MTVSNRVAHSHPERDERDERDDNGAEPAQAAGAAAAPEAPEEALPQRSLNDDPRGLMRTPAGDVVNRATADLPEDQRSAIRWLHAHQVDNNLSVQKASALISYSASVWSQVSRGEYRGNLAAVTKAILRFKKLYEERTANKHTPFIHTHLSREIWKVCDSARRFQKFCFIYGDSQAGKTTACAAYTEENNHGATVMLRMPVGGGLSYFLRLMARALRIPPKLNEGLLRMRIQSSWDDRMLLIVDECDEALFSTAQATKIFEYIRELIDTAHAGCVLVGNDAFRDALHEGEMQPVMTKLLRRRLIEMPLPAVPPREDLDAFSAARGLEPARGEYLRLQTEQVQSHGLGLWLTLLRLGEDVARVRNQPFCWEHVAAAERGRRHQEAAGTSR